MPKLKLTSHAEDQMYLTRDFAHDPRIAPHRRSDVDPSPRRHFMGGRELERGSGRSQVFFYVDNETRGRKWSARGEAAYGGHCLAAEEERQDLAYRGFAALCLEGGVAIPLRPGDPRPGWHLIDDAAVCLLTAQRQVVAMEARGS